MLPILFYEKTGCFNNTKQKNILKEFGCEVLATNILDIKFTQQKLLDFFGEQSIKECVNKKALKLQNININLDTISNQELLNKMIQKPILIKRPLIAIGEKKFCGFDIHKLVNYVIKANK